MPAARSPRTIAIMAKKDASRDSRFDDEPQPQRHRPVDGVTLVDGVTRVLLTAQTTASQNGVYVAAASGMWERAIDADNAAKLPFGTTVQVCDGTNFGT